MNYESGALGNPTELGTLVRFWTLMETLHYPMAGEIKKDLQEALEQQRQTASMQNPMGGAIGPMNPSAGSLPGIVTEGSGGMPV